MKEINEGDKKVLSIIKTKGVKDGAEYKPSMYNEMLETKDNIILHNHINCKTICLGTDEYDLISQKEILSAGDIRRAGLEDAVSSGFIVDSNLNEEQRYLELLGILRQMAYGQGGISSYTILPTTACNARCSYCYEKGIRAVTMTDETADRIVLYIEKTCKKNKEIKLKWFGGEPLACHRIISRICSSLKDRGIKYRSSMVTNASLFNEELAKTSRELWNLQKVQISLDGDKASYESRKRYIDPIRHNYDSVMKSAELFAKTDIRVDLRCNIDNDNLEGIRAFGEETAIRFGGYPKVHMYLSALYGEMAKDSYPYLIRRMYEMQQYLDDIGIGRKKGNNVFKLKLNYCMADSLGTSVLIDPSGDFYNCEHMPAGSSCGSVYDDIADISSFEELTRPPRVSGKCTGCRYLPVCTPFYSEGCPNCGKWCKEAQAEKSEYFLKKYFRG